jgi:hypothetical protein
MEAGVDLGELAEAPDEQGRADEKGHRVRDLGGDERGSDARSAGAIGVAARLPKCRRGARAGAAGSRPKSLRRERLAKAAQEDRELLRQQHPRQHWTAPTCHGERHTERAADRRKQDALGERCARAGRALPSAARTVKLARPAAAPSSRFARFTRAMTGSRA